MRYFIEICYVIGAALLGAIIPLVMYTSVPDPVRWALFALSLPGVGAGYLLYFVRGNTHGAEVVAMALANGLAYAALVLAWVIKRDKRQVGQTMIH
jgi:hypothetical protein